jgi:hypothetical protein
MPPSGFETSSSARRATAVAEGEALPMSYPVGKTVSLQLEKTW